MLYCIVLYMLYYIMLHYIILYYIGYYFISIATGGVLDLGVWDLVLGSPTQLCVHCTPRGLDMEGPMTVNINGFISQKQDVTCGVPQGSIYWGRYYLYYL